MLGGGSDDEMRKERGDFPASGHLIIQKMINRKIPIR
jgi:hypothetical protein